MDVYYSDHFSDSISMNLPLDHRFPIQKYRRLRDELLYTQVLQSEELLPSPLATYEDLLQAHDKDYVDKVFTGELSEAEIRRIGFPWSPALVLRSRATVGGALAAAQSALKNGISGQLAGGTHHAHRSFGSGYCIFNDFAVVSKVLLGQGLVQRVFILDLDVHQGDGNSSILADDERVYVMSFHGAKNFPFRKFKSTKDIELEDHCDDETFLSLLENNLSEILKFKPDLILYQSGVDGLKEDMLGRLGLTQDGLRRRDEMVFEMAHQNGFPISIAIGGGYTKPIDISVKAYVQTFEIAKRYWNKKRTEMKTKINS